MTTIKCMRASCEHNNTRGNCSKKKITLDFLDCFHCVDVTIEED